MSVKRLTLLSEFHGYLSKRVKELFKELDHTKDANFRDIVTHLDYSHKVVKELLVRAKTYQKRDMELKNK